jgi:hypothetical protein
MNRDDFEDDGASFRQRRIDQLAREMDQAAMMNRPAFKMVKWTLVPIVAAFIVFAAGAVAFFGAVVISAIMGSPNMP